MKILLPVMSILMVLFLFSCKEEEVSEVQDMQPLQQRKVEAEAAQPPQQTMPASGVHTVEVQEVIQGNSYTYLNVKDEDSTSWIAISKSEMEVGETISYKNPLAMKNFTSKELERTFETIYFVGRIDKESSSSVSEQNPQSPHQKPAVETKEISIEPIEGGISIAELYSNRTAYANTVVRIKGQVTKVNLGIMGKNWIHLQDGTGNSGSNDLLVTTQETVALGDIVIFEGTIALNKDFGSGYSYEVLMEDAKRQLLIGFAWSFLMRPVSGRCGTDNFKEEKWNTLKQANTPSVSPRPAPTTG
ncbi:MAG: hypothetical protein ACYSTO_09780 [Planctomycetota bacterium]|jgi:hypothetical protein